MTKRYLTISTSDQAKRRTFARATTANARNTLVLRFATLSACVLGAALLLLASAVQAAPITENKHPDMAPIGQKGPNRSASCVGSVPADGLVFADLDTLCPMIAELGSARLETDTEGESYIAATIDGINFSLDVYNCDPQCADLALTASFQMDGATVDMMNEWNASRRFGKAYLRDDGDAVIQIAINTRHGIAAETFRDDLIWWQSVLEDYVSFIGFQ